MLLTNIKTFIKFLSRQRLYTLVTILGFAVGLTFVTILGLYVKQELSVDAVHEKKDRIFLIAQQGSAHFPTRIGKYVSDLFPAVANSTRFD